jgi:hypothetical protein
MADALAADYSGDSADTYEPTQARAIAPMDVGSLMDVKQAGMEWRTNAGR